MTIVAGDVIQAVMNFTMPDGEIAKNVFYMLVSDTGGATQLDLRGQIRRYLDDVYEALGNNVSDTLVAGEVDIYRRNTATDQWDKEGVSTSQWVSTNPGEPVGNQETGVVFADTANPRVTARKSFAGLLEAELSTNTWTVAAQNALTAAAQQWINPPTNEAATIIAGCWSTVNNDFFPFTGSGTTKTLVGSQDTRKP